MNPLVTARTTPPRPGAQATSSAKKRTPAAEPSFLAAPPRCFRRLTAASRALPDYLILGAQKAGTTSLQRYLELHPAVLPPLSKEVHFFDLQSWRGERWYRANFPLRLQLSARGLRARSKAVTGEASPYYLSHPDVPSRVHDLLPGVRMIVIVRDPVTRAHSHYLHNRRLDAEDCATFEEAIEREPQRLEGELSRIQADARYASFAHRHHSYLHRGLYAEQLRAWFARFPREQLLILENDELARDADGVYRRVLDFLGLPAWQPPAFARHNASGDETPLDASLRARLAAWFEPHNQQLYELLGREFAWTRP